MGYSESYKDGVTMTDNRGNTRRAWVKLYLTGWLHGSIRWQLEPDERGVWADLICLAGECGKAGKICDNDGKPYPLKYIANMLNISEELLLQTIDKCKKEERICQEDGILSITNWNVYQSEYERQKKYRDKTTQEDDPEEFADRYGHMAKKDNVQT